MIPKKRSIWFTKVLLIVSGFKVKFKLPNENTSNMIKTITKNIAWKSIYEMSWINKSKCSNETTKKF